MRADWFLRGVHNWIMRHLMKPENPYLSPEYKYLLKRYEGLHI